MKTIYFVCALVWVLGPILGRCSCGENGWIAYNDEKCFKVINQFVNRNDADSICRDEVGGGNSLQPTLSVTSNEEQTFLTNWLFQELGIADSVWLGANRVENNSFSWMDGTSLSYTNWALSFPTNDPDKGCTQMNSHLSKVEDGQWTDVSCIKRNAVVCQKDSKLTLEEMQRILMETKRKLEILDGDFKTLEGDLENVLTNPVPIGFIYVEMPNQPDPQSLWPNVIWQEVTASYAGLFFRAGGGNAAPFNQIQEQKSKRLASVNSYFFDTPLPATIDVPEDGSYSPFIFSGFRSDEIRRDGLRFRLSTDEVRPRNTAVRIWRRVE